MNKGIQYRKKNKRSAWVWNISSNKLSLGEYFCNIFCGENRPIPNEFFELVLDKFNAFDLDSNKPFYIRTKHIPDNKELTLEWFGEVTERDKNQNPVTLAGFVEPQLYSEDFKLSVDDEAHFFSRLMDNIRESVFFKDLDGRFLRINEACAKKFGFDDPSMAVGKTDFDIFDKVHAEAAYKDEQQIIRSKEPVFDKIEKEVFADTNEFRWASTSKMPLYDDNGVLIGTYGITRDITDKVLAEQKLKERDIHFSKLSKQAPGFLYLHKVDVNNNVSFPFVSDGINGVLELEPEVLSNSLRPLFSVVHPDDLSRVIKSITHSVKTRQEWNCEYRVILPEKGLRWVRGKAQPELQEDGSVISSGFLSDITKEKNIELHNKILRKQFEAILDTVPNLIFVKDLDGKFLLVNNATCEFFGLSADEIVGKTDLELGVSKKKAKLYHNSDKEVIKTGKPLFIPEIESKDESGKSIYHQTIKVPFTDLNSSEQTVLTVVTDITNRKEKEQTLNNTLDIVGEQNKRLTNFAHIVSHNLRNHAGNISMLLSLYDMEESQEEKAELMDYLKTASQRLNASIEDLNEIIDQQYKPGSDKKLLNPADTLEKIREILLTDILANNVEIKTDIDPSISIQYNAAYLESIMLNLISNAIKYRNPDKKPIVTVKIYNKKKHVYLEVSDNGIGIDLDKYGHKLFGMYNTFHGNDNAKGIGLFITKNQIESMGGSISVDSTPNEGTTFKVKLI